MNSKDMPSFVPLTLRRRGIKHVNADNRVHDATLLTGVGRAFYWQYLLDTGVMPSARAIARAENLHHTVVCELLRLTLLAPDIIEQFMTGEQPRSLTLTWFQRCWLKVDWHVQRQLIASFEEDV